MTSVKLSNGEILQGEELEKVLKIVSEELKKTAYESCSKKTTRSLA